MEENRKQVDITGIVYSAKKDDNGNTISVLIDSQDQYQETYRVSPGKTADRLIELIGEKVQVSGNISEDSRGHLTININNYILLKES